MAGEINLNRFDASGLAAIAGNSVPNYNFPTQGVTVGDFFKAFAQGQENTANREIQQQNANTNEFQAQNQNEIGRMNAANDQQRNQLLAQEQQRKALQEQVAQKESKDLDTLYKHNAALASAAIGINSALTDKSLSPAERNTAAEEAKNKSLQSMYATGQINKEQMQALSQMPAAQALKVAQQEYLTNNFAIQGKLKQAPGVDDKTSKLIGIAPEQNAQTTNVDKLIASTNESRAAVGQAPMTPQEELAIKNKALSGVGQGMRATPEDVYTTKIAEQDAAKLKPISERNASRNDVNLQVDDAKTAISKVPGALQGPIKGVLAQLTPEGQTAIGKLNGVVLAYKNVLNLGSQGFTDADREFLRKVVGGVENFQGSTQDLLDGLKKLNEHGARYDWLQESQVRKKGNQEDYQQWLADNPEPNAVVQTPDGQFNVPVSKLDVMKKDIPKMKVIN